VVLREDTTTQQVATCYLIQTRDQQGQFDPIAARERGLKPGPAYSALKNGESVEIKVDGKPVVLNPSDVCTKSIPGPLVAIIDCPSIHHIVSLIANGNFAGYMAAGDPSGVPVWKRDDPEQKGCQQQQPPVQRAVRGGHRSSSRPSKKQRRKKEKSAPSARGSNTLVVMAHMSPPHVVAHPDYQAWMDKFGDTQHILLRGQRAQDAPVFCEQTRHTIRLGYASPDL